MLGRLRKVLYASAAMACAGGALAADLPTHKRAAAPGLCAPPNPTNPSNPLTPSPPSWTGPVLGGTSGYSWDGAEVFTDTWSHGIARSGGFGGAIVGYDYQINNFVVGLEGQYKIGRAHV